MVVAVVNVSYGGMVPTIPTKLLLLLCSFGGNAPRVAARNDVKNVIQCRPFRRAQCAVCSDSSLSPLPRA